MPLTPLKYRYKLKADYFFDLNSTSDKILDARCWLESALALEKIAELDCHRRVVFLLLFIEKPIAAIRLVF